MLLRLRDNKIARLQLNIVANIKQANTISELCKKLLMQSTLVDIEQLFNTLTLHSDTKQRVDRIEIDLGKIPQEYFTTMFPQRLLEELAKKLQDCNYQKLVDKADDEQEQLSKLFQQIWPQETLPLFKNDKNNEQWLEELLTTLQPLKIVAMVAAILNRYIRTELLKVLTSKELMFLCNYLLNIVQLRAAQTEPINITTSINSFADKDFESLLVISALLYFQYHPESLPPPRYGQYITLADNNALLPLLTALMITPTSTSYSTLQDWRYMVLSQPIVNKPQKALENDQPVKSTVTKKASEEIELAKDNRIAVCNVGIVLLWPFIPTLLKQLKLIDNEGFIDTGAQWQAVQCLDLLIWGDIEVAELENRLLFTKVFCGLAIEDEMPVFEPLDTEIIEQLQTWLLETIHATPALKKWSSQDITVLFLQRAGRLCSYPDYLEVSVQESLIDFLIKDLSWSLTTPALPWLVKPIQIEWSMPSW